MATQGVLSIVRNGKTVIKVVSGCNGYKTSDLVARLQHKLTLDPFTLWGLCEEVGLGCTECLVVQWDTNSGLSDNNDPLGELYVKKFDDPHFNPRWNFGSAPYFLAIEIDQSDHFVRVYDVNKLDEAQGRARKLHGEPMVPKRLADGLAKALIASRQALYGENGENDIAKALNAYQEHCKGANLQ